MDQATKGSDYTTRPDCRLCGGPLENVLSLGWTPLANELLDTPEASRAQERFPLYLARCQACDHVQVPVVVNPERLFRQYPYVSGTSPAFRQHLRDQAETLVRDLGLKANDLVVEVGSNDGTLLGFFKLQGLRVLGVDPARNVAERANTLGIPTLPEFFNLRLAQEIEHAHGSPKLIVANNVFAHADDLIGIAMAVKSLLHPDGAFVFEVGYLGAMAETGAFDLVYHEHLAFHHLRPLAILFEKLAMKIVRSQHISPQGGSIRVTVKHSWAPDGHDHIQESLALPDRAIEAMKRRKDSLLEFRALLRGWREEGKRVAGYGAPAKLCTLAAVLGLTERDIGFVVDDNPLKHGKHVPGTGIPILPVEDLYRAKPHVVVVTGWNFADSIRALHPNVPWDWVVPLPEVRTYPGSVQ